MKRLAGFGTIALLSTMVLSLSGAVEPDAVQVSLTLTHLTPEQAATLDQEARSTVEPSSVRAVIRPRHRVVASQQVALPRETSAPVPPSTPAVVLPPPVAPRVVTAPVAPRPVAKKVEPVALPAPVIPAPPAVAPKGGDLTERLLEDARRVLQPPPRLQPPVSTPPPRLGARPGMGGRLHPDPGPKQGMKQDLPERPMGKTDPRAMPKKEGPRPR
jgi:hypothetical protein